MAIGSWGRHNLATSWLAIISITPLWGSDFREALQLRAAHQPGPQKLGPGPLSGSLLGTTEEHGEWRPLPPWSPTTSPSSALETPLPVFRVPYGGRGGGGLELLGPVGWRKCQFCYRPGGDPVPMPPGFSHKGASLTGQSGLQTPADKQAGGRM